MRIKVRLAAREAPFALPINYNYHLAALIYRTLARSSEDYSRFLHDEGYRSGAKRFKLFTFSQLLLPKRRIAGDKLIGESSFVELLISSPVDQFVNHLASGLLSQNKVELAGVRFAIKSIEALPLPEFSEGMRFTCLSPLVASTMVERDGKLQPHYYRYDDPRLSAAIGENLRRKLRLLSGREPPGGDFRLEFDRVYLKRHQVEKLIDYKGTRIKGLLAPFTARGPVELLQIGYEAGFGEKGSMGFGMVAVVEP